MNVLLIIILTLGFLRLINFFFYNWLWNRFYYNQVDYFFKNTWKMSYVSSLSSNNEIVLKHGNKEYVYVTDTFGYLTIYEFENYSMFSDFNTVVLKENSFDWITNKKFLKIKSDVSKKNKKHAVSREKYSTAIISGY
jgi:hypothetical protein